MTHERTDAGFTLVEIGVIVPILMLMAIGIFSLMFAYLLSSNREQVRLDQTYVRSEALDRIETDVRLSASFLEAEDSSMTDPYQSFSSGGSWSFSGNGGATGNNNDSPNHRVLILREYATTNNPLSSVRQPVYTRNVGAPDCTIGSNIAGPLMYDVLYFVYNSTLYKRTVTNPTGLACESQYQKVSCPPNDVLSAGGVSSRDNACAADDEVVAQNVSGFTVDYYTNQASPAPLDAYNTSGLAPNAKSVNVTIVTSSPAYSGDITSQSSEMIPSQNGGS